MRDSVTCVAPVDIQCSPDFVNCNVHEFYTVRRAKFKFPLKQFDANVRAERRNQNKRRAFRQSQNALANKDNFD